jgi:hypothetical protein
VNKIIGNRTEEFKTQKDTRANALIKIRTNGVGPDS